tara:strand:- start:2953 stop:3807 length:855 start_codon:yes stop_codon:yes gene_type:complete
MSTIGDELLMAIAQPQPGDDTTPEYLAALIERLLQDPPQGWDEDKKMSLAYAVQVRYQNLQAPQIPGVVESKLLLVELTDGTRNPLVKLVQRAGPQGTATVEACKEMLAKAEARDIGYQQVATVLLYLALSTGYNAKNFVAAMREHRVGQRLDWQDVVKSFDRDHLRIEKHQFLAIYNALLPIAQETETVGKRLGPRPDASLLFVVILVVYARRTRRLTDSAPSYLLFAQDFRKRLGRCQDLRRASSQAPICVARRDRIPLRHDLSDLRDIPYSATYGYTGHGD